jgi:TetR/AcrR family transcriptional regulator, transcriptional repressor of bet genes
VPKTVDHRQRHDEIVEAAWRVMAEEGFEAATMRRIAEEAGCTTGRITHYFDSKDDILLAALRAVHTAAAVRMARQADRHTGLEALRRVIDEALPLDATRIQEWRVWLAFWGHATARGGLVAEQRRRYRSWRALLRSLLDDAAELRELPRALDRDLAVDRIVAVVDGLGIQLVFEPRRFTRPRVGRLIDAVLDDLAR